MSKFIKNLFTPRSIAMAGIIAALYAALTVLLAPISYGAWQCRVSEALTLLPILLPQAIPGLTIGCLVANLVGGVGIADIVFGTLATLIASIGTYIFRKKIAIAAAFPVVANGLIIGIMLSVLYQLPVILTIIQVAAGELLAVLLGVLLMKYLRKIDFNKFTK